MDPAETTVASFDGRRVRLRPIRQSDYERIRDEELSAETILIYRHQGLTPSPEQHAGRLWAGVSVQFIVEDKHRKQPVGVVTAFDVDFRSGHAQLSALVFKDFREHGWPLEGVEIFIDFLFMAHGLRKIYGHSSAANFEQFKSALRGVAREEGRLQSHEFVNGVYLDKIILAIYREDWQGSKLTKNLAAAVAAAEQSRASRKEAE
jgi:RimJ/RimL family protein N-acetyltransferase